MKWRLRFAWMKARPAVTFLVLLGVPFLPVVPWVLAAGPGPAPLPQAIAGSETVSLTQPIPTGVAARDSLQGERAGRGPSPPLDPPAIRKAARRWEVKAIDGSGWNLLMTDRFAVRGDIQSDDLRAVGAFAERFLDAIHLRLKGDLSDLRLSIRVFAQEHEFAQWVSCHQLEPGGPPYDRHGAEVALLFAGTTDVSDFCGRLMRGVVLEYFDRALEYRGPEFVTRSIADWFADYTVSKGAVSPRSPRTPVHEVVKVSDPRQIETAWKAWMESAE